MKKRINLITLFILIIVAIFIGIALGYLITKNINKEQIVKEVSSEDTKVETEKNIESKNENSENVDIANNNAQITTTTNPNIETLKYDGSKNIVVNGKTYVVSYKNESNLNENEEFETVLYINNKKIKIFEHKNFDDNVNRFDYKNFELFTINDQVYENREYVVILVRLGDYVGDAVLIVNQEEVLLNTIWMQRGYAACGFSNNINPEEFGMDKDNGYYKISNNEIIYLARAGIKTTKDETYYGVLYKIIVRQNEVFKYATHVFTQEEVHYAGK